ncbi:chymotrypsinogen A-like isoform X2 [Dreissena polymorpha]|uniref:chymotrypsinogen A-like isoform X2 n=1 Tax=Dreissena polymorpha TaxID=45954 RepID=UPI00226442B3|nr:chymotrypsinogen A-like isoform X2 [Dreissena polymorpha]
MVLFMNWHLADLGGPTKIINGGDAVPGAHPHQVSLQWNQRPSLGLPGAAWYHICGGSAIDVNVVLTAAHCVDFGKASEFRVVVGDHRLYEYDGTEYPLQVSRIYLHEDWIPGLDYNNNVYPNDIAVLTLTMSFVNTNIIIPLDDDTDANADSDRTGQNCIISGWGLNDTNSDIVNTLQDRNMTVLSQTECEQYWGEGGYIFRGHICVFDGPDGTTGGSACNGDSGGPLVCQGKLAGVTSWGREGCRMPNTGDFMPSVYARVSHYRAWIEMTLGRLSGSTGRG